MLKQKLDQKQIQKLMLAPALQQAIRLLPLTNLELIEVIDAELAENPLLEEVTSGESPEIVETTPEKTSTELGAAESSDLGEMELSQDKVESEEDTFWEEVIFHYLDDSPDQFNQEEREELRLENILSRGPSLWDHLHWQANLTFFTEQEKDMLPR